MKGSETKLVQYMQGSNKRFVIPVYQRNYDWKTENCKQLFDDLIKVVREGRKNHFFGSIVSVYNPEGANDEFLVIDGQQRLTTVSLLLLAMYNLMEQKIITPDKNTLSERIYEEYLVDKWQDDETRIKLKPVKNDRIAFGRLFDASSEHIKESNLTINYDYFHERIQKEELTPDTLFDAICRLEIISITLNGDDNPQLIFESLNSTGLALSEGDKIRNFILMGLPTKLQNDCYERYWNKIEIHTGYDVSAFIRDYLSVKQQSTPNINRVYYTFKAYVEDNTFEVETLLSDLLAYAKWYEILLKGNTANRKLNSCIYRLNRLETTVTRPFFLEVLRLWAEEMLSYEGVLEIFLTTENYLFRRTMCDLASNSLNKVFLTLHKEISRYDGSVENYTAKFKYALFSKKERTRFPTDDEFVDAFKTRQVYLMNSKNKVYVLERLENFGTLEDKDVYRHLDNEDYSIEHIMPQHLTPAWINDLGEDYEQIHDTWLHRIANLTLTAYNPKYSNNTFREKKTCEDGYLESGIRMNQIIAQKDRWTLAELEERSAYLSNKALEIWAVPQTDYKPAEKELDSYTLDDEETLSGRVISRFRYKNTEQPVTSWIEMFERVLKILHAEDKSVLNKLAYSKNTNLDLSAYVSNESEVLRGSCEIEPSIYVEKNTSTGLKISLLRKFFALYGADPADLVFYLRDEGEKADEGFAGTRFDLRKRYWNYALEQIRMIHGGGIFTNVNPSKDNWINASVGISGFVICCVANFDSARVELVFNKSNSDDNKAAFDMLVSHKDEIESALGTVLIWNRGNDMKSSKIYCHLENVGIEDEENWHLVAKFHADWSKRFYDALMPYLGK